MKITIYKPYNEKRLLKKDFLKIIKENEIKDILYLKIIGYNKTILFKNTNFYITLTYKEYNKYKHLLKIEN